jgi:hypothetical protein
LQPSSQTCGARVPLPGLWFQAHRDVVGAANILSRQLFGELGKARPPPTTMYRHPFLAGKRSGLDTDQPSEAVACDQQEAARL